MIAEMGTTTRDGLLQITDTAWDHSGTMRVTVRELVGDRTPGPVVRERARRLARRALPEYHKGQTRSAATVRTWYADGCSHWTFKVSRLEQF